MPARTPRRLKQKRAELAYERMHLAARQAQVDGEIAAIDYALRVLDADWEPPRVVAKPNRPRVLPRGAVAQACLQCLRQHDSMWVAAIAKCIADRYKLTFADKQRKQDFASSVAMALRRYARRGLVEVVERDARTQALRWRLCAGTDGRLPALRRAA